MRLNALCLIGSLTALAIPLPAGAVPASRQGQYRLSWVVKQPLPLHKASRPLTFVLPDIIGNRTLMPGTGNFGRLIARAAGE
jgi:hypothetical protein